MSLTVDMDRWNKRDTTTLYNTGLTVRARFPDKTFAPVDIGYLDRDSLIEWLDGVSHLHGLMSLYNIIGTILNRGNLIDSIKYPPTPRRPEK
jgi:hypothetical protein